jgi:DNA repair exonuclease SbcCD ATPase subunit
MLQIEEELNRVGAELHKRVGARDSILARTETLMEEITVLDGDITSTEKAVWLLQNYGESQQKMLTERIEGIVTKGLRAVFQNPTLDFKLKYSETKSGERKRNPEVAMTIQYEHDGEVVEGNLKSSFGGGISVVAAILLKVVIVLHLEPRVKPILLLDEPLKDLSPAYEGGDAVSSGYRDRMADFLRSLVDQTDLQIIMVSHEPEYGRIADIHHRFSGGVGQMSTVKTIKHETELEDI